MKSRGQKCRVCEHPDRARIELQIARRVPNRRVASNFNISPDSVQRHKHNHMPAQLLAALVCGTRETEIDLEQLRVSESEGMLQHLLALRGRLYALLDQAEEDNDINAATRVHGRLNENLKLTGQLVGELNSRAPHVVNNVLILPQYLELRTSLVRALQPFPEASQAVAQVLRTIETDGAKEIEQNGIRL